MGNFCKGDIVEIINNKNEKLGKGISYYDSIEIKKIKGKKVFLLKKYLDMKEEEVVHRDYLFLEI